MRNFAIMNDGKIVSIQNVHKDMYSKDTHFYINQTEYKYSQNVHFEERLKYWYPCFSKCFYKYNIEHCEWYVTNDVEYILFLDEEEDEELNYFQSTDFNAGVMYTYVEKTVGLMLKDKGAISVLADFTIPAIQLIPRSAGSIQEGETIKATIKAATEHFDAVYGKNFNLNIYSWKMDKQYFKFEYSVKRKETYKEMTVAEIEEALGYKIKIVGDNE